ncbi:DEAD/DEAH box helicase [Leucobacter chromiireducens]|uniref:DEAD/DEAH box helicase n=1 Tax=Leucobacter chromiireducens TaxID=283877 RepID=UPI000F62CADF
MASKGRRGFKAPANYEPGRKPKGRKFHGGRAQDPSAGSPRRPARDDAEHPAAGRDGGARRDPAQQGSRSDRRDPAQRDAGAKSARAASTPRQDRGPREQPLARLDAKLTTAADAAGVSFGDLGLGGNIVRVLGELGATQPFPIQVATIPDIVRGRDVLGRARTGSGKTIAFGSGLVERLLLLKAQGALGAAPSAKAKSKPQPKRGERAPQRPTRNPKALILAPTRELALQIDRTIQPIARSVGFYTAQLVGGVPLDPQVHALQRGIDIVIGTPGRVQDLVNRRKLDLREVLITVLDEADHMCDLGFLEPVQNVLRQTVRGGQRLLFSATLDSGVTELVEEFLRDPAVHEAEAGADGTVRHRVQIVLWEHKDQALVQLASAPGRVLVFCRTRAYAERVAELLGDAGLRVAALHGDLSQSRRERNLEKFATGKASVLVATDVAARGIHVDDVDLVLQADPPDDYKTYLHRAGRTGRAGRDGVVVTVIARTRQKRTRELLENAGIVPEVFEDFVPAGAVAPREPGAPRAPRAPHAPRT